MPFQSSGSYPISSKDVVSFTFDDPGYDEHRPVGYSTLTPAPTIIQDRIISSHAQSFLSIFRSSSTQKILQTTSPTGQPKTPSAASSPVFTPQVCSGATQSVSTASTRLSTLWSSLPLLERAVYLSAPTQAILSTNSATPSRSQGSASSSPSLKSCQICSQRYGKMVSTLDSDCSFWTRNRGKRSLLA